MRLYRLIAILTLMETRGCVKAQELADALEVSARTVYRDIDTLCQAGIPIAATTGPNGGIYLMEGYSRLMQLNGEDAVNLYLSGIVGNDSRMEDGSKRLREALFKLENALPAQYGRDIRAARERFYFDDAPWWGKQNPPECLAVLRQAVLRLTKLKIEYVKPDGIRSERVICPYGLVVKNGGWYLIAFCETSEGLRTFKADRIVCADMVSEGYDIPANFDLEQYWLSGVNNFLRDKHEGEVYPVLIRANSADQWLLEQLDVLDSWTEDNSILAQVNMHRQDLACDEALKIIWHAEILSPQGLRAQIASRFLALLQTYQAGTETIQIV